MTFGFNARDLRDFFISLSRSTQKMTDPLANLHRHLVDDRMRLGVILLSKLQIRA